MATFYNQAQLTYNNNTVNSNIVSAELVEVISATKAATTATYSMDDSNTYVINLVNSGTVDVTGLTVTDTMGEYTTNDNVSVVPLTYVDNSVLYFINGVQQTAPAVTSTSPLIVTGVSVPAGGNTSIVYKAQANEFAPRTANSNIVNTATITGAAIATPLTVSAATTAGTEPELSIVKSVTPETVTENGTVTYTFVIENMGNSDAADSVVVTDTFLPVLNNLTVTYNGAAWTSPANYTYDETTGQFATVAGQITVPAATFAQDTRSGAVTTTPGTATIRVTGTI